jgi:N-methylhydantoinase A
VLRRWTRAFARARVIDWIGTLYKVSLAVGCGQEIVEGARVGNDVQPAPAERSIESRVARGSYVIGIDVGGTFTDAVCSDGVATWRAKAPTNPAKFSEGVIGSCSLIARQLGVDLGELLKSTQRFGLGTTAVTNVIATRRGRTVGLITTRGFENHLHAMRNHRKVIDGWLTMHWNPVALDAVRGIDERIDRDGNVVSPIDVEEVSAAARDLVENCGVNAFAVSFLWSVRNDAHEIAALDAIKNLYPNIPAFSGVELNPVMREYERTTLAVLSAFTANALDGVDELAAELKRLGLSAPMLLLHSGGGAMTVSEARATPLALASSGPAAGAVAAGEASMAAGLPDALCCDMGGTSIDVAVVRNGVPERRTSADIGGMITGQPAIDVESIGAGGGSIAWIDDRGMLRVGPHSARATPGPVCYGRGGTEPTVTDAMILLGYIDPAAFMGGAMKLDVESARAACERLGKRIGLSAIEIAFGIREIALAEMGKAMRARISSGGIDVRKYGVVAFGGSGSLFATAMAQDIGLAWVLTPSIASVLSAYGAATADIRRERAHAVDALLPGATIRAAEVLADLRLRANSDIAAQGVAPENREMVCEVDLRFLRQRASLTLTLNGDHLDAGELVRRFQETYAKQYGASSLTAQTPVELSTVRVVGIGRTTRAVLPKDRQRIADGETLQPTGRRAVFLLREKATTVPVYDAGAMRMGQRIDGPALIDTVDTTLWAPVGSQVALVHGDSFLTTFGAQQ